MSEQLNTQLKKIQHASPLLRKQATFGVFQLIKRLPSTAKDAAAAAIATCLARHDCAVRGMRCAECTRQEELPPLWRYGGQYRCLYLAWMVLLLCLGVKHLMFMCVSMHRRWLTRRRRSWWRG